jgi:serine/threonine-protein kinase
VHRDIKPENIMLTRLFDGSDRVVLVDFGAAIDAERREVSDASATLTAAGFVLGTPSSMSPEQLAGEAATRSADIYAAGVLMFEMLVGRMPFAQQNLRDLLLAKQQPPPRLPAVVPPAVSHYIAWLMQQRPEDRPNSCTQALAGLDYARAVTRRSRGSRTFFDLLGPAYAVEAPANGGTQRSGAR